VNCNIVPFAIEGLTGVTAIDVKVAAVTVRVVDRDIPLNVALIVVEPVAMAVTSPFESDALLIVATLVLDELQVTAVVRFCVVLSE
jgi:hypothetical protein